ncbi:MAG: tellurite resistance TerB family protein [Myxococcales bacterium]|nr:tellurite resistance TerB family protein [Myxococcales bacterium]
MQLDDRLKKIASGMRVTDAIESWVKEHPEVEIDPDAEMSEELLAIIELMFLMAAIDGEVADDELRELQASVSALADMQAVGSLELSAMIDDLTEKLANEGWKARLESAAARVRAPDAREFAFQLAAGVAFVDDFVAHAEAAALDSLARALDLSKDESQRLLRDVHETLFQG